MAERINLAQLRDWTRYPPHWIDAPVGPDEVLALLDAVEAAQHAREARALLTYEPAKLTPAALDQATRHLNAALDKFDFGDQP